MKRFFYLFIVIAAVGIVVLIGYFIRYRSEIKKEVTEEASPFQPGLPGASLPPTLVPRQEGSFPLPSTSTATSSPIAATTTVIIPPGSTPRYTQFSAVAENPVAEYAIDENNNISLIQPDGQIIKIINKKATVLSSATIVNLRQASFSPDAQKVFVIFGNLENLQANIFNLLNQTWQPLPQGVISAAWSPDSQKIVYSLKDANQTVLMTLDINDSKNQPEEILRLYAEDLFLSWPSKNEIILSGKGSTFIKASSWKFDLSQKKLFLLVEDKYGLQLIYEPTTQTRLFFSTDNYDKKRKNLWLVSPGQSRQLSFFTLPSKCVFRKKENFASISTSSLSQPEIFLNCAIPQDHNGLNRFFFPDDYYKKAVFTADDFYQINLKNGEMQLIYSNSEKTIDAYNLKISNDQLFFVNRFDQKLYVLPLPSSS